MRGGLSGSRMAQPAPLAERPNEVYDGYGHGVRTRTVLDSVGSVGTLPGALPRTLVAR